MDFREYIGFSPTSENVTIKESVIRPIDQLSFSDDSDNELIVEIEAVHAYPYVTKNSTRYSYQGLEDSLSEWTHPYNIPIIMHHNDQDGQIIGRAIDARLGDSERLVGSKALFITAKILDEKAQKRYQVWTIIDCKHWYDWTRRSLFYLWTKILTKVRVNMSEERVMTDRHVVGTSFR